MPKSSRKSPETALDGEIPAKQHDWVAETAHFLAEKRGFAVENELDHWYALEGILAEEP